jgi:hypothetical protein
MLPYFISVGYGLIKHKLIRDMKSLLDIGFEDIGNWILIDDGIKFEIKKYSNTKNALYAFVVDENVKYVGKTTNTLSKRLSGYQKPGPTQSTNQSKNKKILQSLKDGQQVQIFARTDAQKLFVGEFHLNIAAGLEDSIIATLAPEWNGRPQRGLPEPPAMCFSDSFTSNAQVHVLTTLANSNVFSVVLRASYWRDGFFNVGIKNQAHFGGNGETVHILLGDTENAISANLNRKSTANGTPRIMGGRNWQHGFINIKLQMLY